MARATIGIDCRLGGVRHGGIGRYIAEYVSRVVASSSYHFSLVFSDEAQRDELLALIPDSEAGQISTTIVNIRHYSLQEQLKLPGIYTDLNLDLLHVPHFNVPLGFRGPLVVTIHDLLWHSTKGTSVTTLPAWQYWFKYGAYKLTVSTAVKRASRIFVPTQFVAATLSQHYPKATDKLVVTYEGVGKQFTPNASVMRDDHLLLYVGSLYPHKNVSVILDALKNLPEHRLVIVSARDAFAEKFQEKIKELGLSDRVELKSSVPDKQLLQLYWSAGFVIQPSTSEGFGLTGLEAIACNSPLIASDIPVFHEVYGEAAHFFDPMSAESLQETIAGSTTAGEKSQAGARRAVLERYSWDTMTDTMLKTFTQLL